MRTPFPFLPCWTAEFGPLLMAGCGLLPTELSQKKDQISKFTVHLGTYRLTVNPQAGTIERDGRLELVSEPGVLLWFRRMEINLATRDSNSGAPECLWYGVGIESPKGKSGMRLLADGKTVLQGVN